MATLGVHSEAGTLRTVLVCRPGLAQERLFDAGLSVHEARKDHDDFVLTLRQHEIEVLELHDLLSEAIADASGRAFVLDRRITPNEVGPGLAPVLRAWLDQMPSATLAEHLVGGIGLSDLPQSERISMMSEALGDSDFIIPPLPGTLFQRDPSCWIYNGVTCNPMSQSAREPETLLMRTIYKCHPRFKAAGPRIWWGDSDECFGAARMRGGDVMSIGQGVVLVGMGEYHSTAGRVSGCRRALQERGGDSRDLLPDAEGPRGLRGNVPR